MGIGEQAREGYRRQAAKLLRAHHSDYGLGLDEYSDTAQVHPMAEGKFLSALAELSRSGEELPVEAMAQASIDRLHSLSVASPGGKAWGLGFAWKDSPADATYTITSVLVAEGLRSIIPLLEGGKDAARDLYEEAMTALLSPSQQSTVPGISLVRFGSSMPQAVVNVVAMWAGAVAAWPTATSEDKARAALAAHWARKRLIPGVGWAYEEGSRRADFLHTCYIINGLSTALGESPSALPATDATAALLVFHGFNQWLDKADIHALPMSGKTTPHSNQKSCRISGDHLIEVFDTPARTWSLGELLVTGSRLSTDPLLGAFWEDHLPGVARQALALAQSDRRPRHTMHVAHGLAVLGAARTPA